MPLVVDRPATVKLEIPREEFDKYVQSSEMSYTATAKSMLVTGALLAGAAYGIAKNWEVVFMAGSNHCFSRTLTQCAKKLVQQAFAQSTAVPLIGPGAPTILETVAKTWASMRAPATAMSAFHLVNNSVALQVVLGSLFTAAITKPVEYTARKITATLWPSNASSTTAKVFKVAALATIVLAGIYAAGYIEQMQKLAKHFTCPQKITIETETLFTNGTQALNSQMASDIVTTTPAPLAVVSDKFGALANYFTGTESDAVLQVAEGLKPLAEVARVTQPTLETTQETVNMVHKRIGDAAIIHNIWLTGQNIAVAAVGVTTTLSLLALRIRGVLNR